VAYTTFGWMLRVAPLPLVTTYAYVNPVIAVILGFLIAGEAIDVRTIIAGAVIVAAVAMIVTARGRMQAPRPDRLESEGVADGAVAVPLPTTARAPTP
jgi:drug/metabolite transporter (DMT)-like permease